MRLSQRAKATIACSVYVAVCSAFALTCAGAARPACQPGEAAKIEAAFIAELVAACDVEPEQLEQCPAFEPIRARYRTPRLDVLERCQ